MSRNWRGLSIPRPGDARVRFGGLYRPIPGEQISHGICPPDLPWPADRCDIRDTAVGIFSLAVPDVRARDANIAGEMEFVTHVPGITVRHRDEGLREFSRFPERIEVTLIQRERLSAFGES
jgi:hypothetical protein